MVNAVSKNESGCELFFHVGCALAPSAGQLDRLSKVDDARQGALSISGHLSSSLAQGRIREA